MRMRSLVVAAALVSGALPATARAEVPGSETWDGRAETGAHCGYVNEMANGERALLMAPQIFAVTGTLASGSEETGDANSAVEASLRRTASTGRDSSAARPMPSVRAIGRRSRFFAL